MTKHQIMPLKATALKLAIITLLQILAKSHGQPYNLKPELEGISDSIVILPPNNTRMAVNLRLQDFDQIVHTYFTTEFFELMKPLLLVWKNPLVIIPKINKNGLKDIIRMFQKSKRRGTKFVSNVADNMEEIHFYTSGLYCNGNDQLWFHKMVPPTDLRIGFLPSAHLNHGAKYPLILAIQNYIGVKNLDAIPFPHTMQAVGEILNGTLDLLAEDVPIMLSTWKIVDFSHYTYLDKIKLVPSLLTLTDIFEGTTWAATLCMGLAVIGLMIMSRLCAGPNWSSVSTVEAFRVGLDTIFVLFKVAMPLSTIKQSSTVIRMFLIVWLLCATLLTMAYTSTVLAHLVKKTMRKPIDSPEDLLESNYVLGLPIGITLQTLFQTSPRKVMRDVYKVNVLERGGLYDFGKPGSTAWLIGLVEANSHCGVARLRNKPFFSKNNVVFSKESVQEQYGGWTGPLGFPLMERIDQALIRLHDSGVLKKILSPYWKGQYGKEETTEEEVLSLGHLVPLWIITPCGILWSLLTFLMEKFISK